MELVIRDLGGCTVARLVGRLDAASVGSLDAGLEACVARGTRSLVLDLAALDYVSSAGLRSVLAVTKRLKAAGGGVAISGLAGLVKEVFAISGVDTLLPVRETVEEAAQSLRTA